MCINSNTNVKSNRLDAQDYLNNFNDLYPPLDTNKARIESDRCYFCHDAPCMQACPTSIDIPLFIRQISAANPDGAAQTIFNRNIIGGMCARVCPTETLCEEVCVHVEQGNTPVKIGQLQRFATDHAMRSGRVVFDRAPDSGKHVAVIGAGPAGLSCAHRLAANGHNVSIFEAREKPGGLNEYGLAAYKVTNNFARAEAEFVLSIGGIDIKYGQELGRDISLEELAKSHDAVFLGLGLTATNNLDIEGEELENVHDAVEYIAALRQAENLAELPVGQRVIVIGGGMTAIDIAVQIKKLGSRDVSIIYRRGKQQMGASAYERQLAQTHGICITLWAKPLKITGNNGYVTSMSFERTRFDDDGVLIGTGEVFELAADQVFKAIGQGFDSRVLGGVGLAIRGGRIAVDGRRKTSFANIWAGGDCIAGGNDLTVTAAEDGNIAAAAINRFLNEGKSGGRGE